MSDMLEQLLKAGIVSKADADRAAKPPPRPPGRGGDSGRGRRGGNDGQQRHGGKRQQRGGDRPRGGRPRVSAAERAASARQAKASAEQAAQAQAPANERDIRAEVAVAAARLAETGRGPKRWYFEARDGTVPALDVSAKVFDGLSGGALVVAESPEGERSIITGDAAAAIGQYAPLWLRNSDL